MFLFLVYADNTERKICWLNVLIFNSFCNDKNVKAIINISVFT